ncbi:MAG: SDR family oxidoreductase [Chloroflexi bacterium]|nr:SDR family oxidoreductase [Chloroflexota bacterium]
MLKILVVGGSSAIAHEAARHFAADGGSLFLVDIDAEKLDAVAADLRTRGAAKVETHVLDVTAIDQHQAMLDAAIASLDGLDAVLIAYGTLGKQEESQADVSVALREMNINLISVIALLTIVANHFEAQKRGCIAAISSVAGDRGRQSNYVYGTAKAGVSAFMQGLRNRLAKSGVSVVTIKPGMVDTPMTAHMKKTPLFSKPHVVGKAIYDGMRQGRGVVYAPWYWRFVMLIIRNIPEPIFKRMSL